MSKVFIADIKTQETLTYQDLIQSINNVAPQKYIYENSPIEVMVSLMASIWGDYPIELLDSDFTMDEIKRLTGERHINLPLKIQVPKLRSMTEFIEKTSNLKKWNVGLYTSGTTGLPKKVNHSFSTLTRGLQTGEKHAQDRWALAYNPTHIAGLQVFFQALMNQNTMYNFFQCSPEVIVDGLKKFEISHISATPSFYRLILPIQPSIDSVKRVSCGGEKLDDKIRLQLESSFTKAKIKNIYASTEAGTLLTSSDGNKFTAPPKYADKIKIENQQLMVHKSLLAHDYESEWYNTGDCVDIISTDPLVFSFTKRVNEYINVGGQKVNPSEVEEVILSFPGIRSARVFGIPNSVTTNLVCCEVVTEGKELNILELRKFLTQKLQSYKVPRQYKKVDQVILTRTGKRKL